MDNNENAITNMKLLVVTCARAYRTPDGEIFTPSTYDYGFFRRYLAVFEEIRVVACCKTITYDEVKRCGYIKMSGPGLTLYGLKWEHGMKDMPTILPSLIKQCRNAAEGCDRILYRAPQLESYLIYLFARKKGIPYAVEVVIDPATMNNKGKQLNIWLLKHMISKANGVSYVTKHYLQNLYPCRAILKGQTQNYFTEYYTSGTIDKVLDIPKTYPPKNGIFKLLHVANSISSESKGHRSFIKVVKYLVDKGCNVCGICVGDGPKVGEFKNLAVSLGIGEHVQFTGRIGEKEKLYQKMEECDLMLFPTSAEGLPRVLIEAMSRGLPCLSTPVCGIPELLEDQFLFEKDDISGFGEKIEYLIEHPEELNAISKINLSVAREYLQSALEERRTKFYQNLKDCIL